MYAFIHVTQKIDFKGLYIVQKTGQRIVHYEVAILANKKQEVEE